MKTGQMILIAGLALVAFRVMMRPAAGVAGDDGGFFSFLPDIPDAKPLFAAPHQAPPLVRDLSLAEELARGLRPL